MATIEFNDVTKSFDRRAAAVDGFNLSVNDGEFMVLVGPSGCGKTTALRMAAGLEEPTSGTISMDGTVVNGMRPTERDVAMVFQSYALYPHMTVFENMAYPLRCMRVPRASVREQVEQAAKILQLTDYLKRKPAQLSGGQRQRVAMGRAIVRQPRLFLMDEPLSNLDAKLRLEMRADLARMQREIGVTTIYVTHDQSEAMGLSDRIAVVNGGHVEQCGTADEVYERPSTMFVATFLGAPPMNLLPAKLEERGDGRIVCRVGDQELSLSPGRAPAALRDYIGRTVAFGFRPEAVHFGTGIEAESLALRAVATHTETLPPEQLVYLDVAGASVSSDTPGVSPEMAKLLRRVIARVPIDVPVSVGESVTASIPMTSAHFFDLQTGDVISNGARVPTSTIFLPAGR
ncbi:ABC transporter ATP-binding protein [Microbacterium sp.]|uniref:ABC transporter ATP-binding protein n=1 Tax=Microbacterium sp. TaxID=51671 RepID=UPI0039E3B029